MTIAACVKHNWQIKLLRTEKTSIKKVGSSFKGHGELPFGIRDLNKSGTCVQRTWLFARHPNTIVAEDFTARAWSNINIQEKS